LHQPALQAGGQQPPSGEPSLAAAEAPKGLAAIAAFNKTPREVPKKWCRVVCLCIGLVRPAPIVCFRRASRSPDGR
jgi:hypothetical protein